MVSRVSVASVECVTRVGDNGRDQTMKPFKNNMCDLKFIGLGNSLSNSYTRDKHSQDVLASGASL